MHFLNNILPNHLLYEKIVALNMRMHPDTAPMNKRNSVQKCNSSQFRNSLQFWLFNSQLTVICTSQPYNVDFRFTHHRLLESTYIYTLNHTCTPQLLLHNIGRFNIRRTSCSYAVFLLLCDILYILGIKYIVFFSPLKYTCMLPYVQYGHGVFLKS